MCVYTFLNVCAKSLQSFLTLCDPMDSSPLSQSPLSMGFSRQECWDCCALLQGNLPDPGIKPTSLISLDLVGGFFTSSAIWEDRIFLYRTCLLANLKLEIWPLKRKDSKWIFCISLKLVSLPEKKKLNNRFNFKQWKPI